METERTGYTPLEKLFYAFSIFALLLFAVHAHTYAFGLDLSIATSGFSILEVLQAHENAEGFLRDYPGGSRLTTASSPTVYVYYLGSYLGIDGMIMLYFMIILEMCTLLTGAWVLWRALFKSAFVSDPKLEKYSNIAFIWVAYFLLISSTQRANLALFGYPFFHGQFYGFADGLRLAVLAMVLQKKWSMASILFFVCFIIHPIKALIVACCAAFAALIEWRSLFKYNCLIPTISSLALCTLWYYGVLATKTDPVPLQDFVDYTLTFQTHWYPVQNGLFGKIHIIGITPFVAVMLMMIIAIEQIPNNASLRGGLYWGLFALVVLTAFGVYVSVDLQSATLIRISFIRASNLISLLAPIIIVMGSIFAWRECRWGIAAGLMAFLALSFEPHDGFKFFSPAFAFFLVGLNFYYVRKLNYPIIIITIILVPYIVILNLNHSVKPGLLFAALPSLMLTIVFWTVLILSDRLKFIVGNLIVPLVMTAFVIVGGGVYSVMKVVPVQQNSAFNEAYLEVQEWAKQNTSKTALFMVDPCRWYGWRDFSGRPSIGTTREWYMTAWIYRDQRGLLNTGRNIAETLGFDMEPHRANPAALISVCKAARFAYYDPTLTGPRNIAQKFEVNYFVFEKEYAPKLLTNIADKTAFQNKHFFVLAADEL